MKAGESISHFQAGQTVLLAITTVLLLAACRQDNSVQPDASQAAAGTMTISEVVDRAMLAMGMAGVDRIEVTANGWEACLGQPWNINAGWARWSITDYNRVIDYATFNSYQSAQRQAGMDPAALGGCGAQPGAAPQNQQSSVNPESSWLQQLQVHLTPMGFLRLAGDSDARVVNGADGLSLVIEEVQAGGIHYRLIGSYGEDYLLDHVITWVDDSVFGDMPFEAEFSEYRDFGGIQFPSHVVQKQGGFATLDLAVTAVVPNTTASAEPPAAGGGGFGGGQQPDLPPYEMIGEDIYALHGGYQSVIMGFDDYIVVLDGLQNDTRAGEIIATAKELFPGKPIGYVLTTHAHFDHASGLRQFVAEGATLITHRINAAFFAQALAKPRTLHPEMENTEGLAVNILGVENFLAIDDGTHRVQFHKLNGSTHADDALIAYIPAINTIVEADLLQPWINPVFGGGDHPFLVWFADELERLGLDYEQFVPIHRPSNPPLMSRADLLEAVGRL